MKKQIGLHVIYCFSSNVKQQGISGILLFILFFSLRNKKKGVLVLGIVILIDDN